MDPHLGNSSILEDHPRKATHHLSNKDMPPLLGSIQVMPPLLVSNKDMPPLLVSSQVMPPLLVSNKDMPPLLVSSQVMAACNRLMDQNQLLGHRKVI